MSVIQECRCDRCGVVLPRSRGIITVNYHHPRKLDLCRDCEGEFTIWLGKLPLWGTPLADIVAGRASGDGYPSREQIEALKKDQNGA
jgi:NAD-dependent SIR2 family protein deacetylase